MGLKTLDTRERHLEQEVRGVVDLNERVVAFGAHVPCEQLDLRRIDIVERTNRGRQLRPVVDLLPEFTGDGRGVRRTGVELVVVDRGPVDRCEADLDSVRTNDREGRDAKIEGQVVAQDLENRICTARVRLPDPR